MLAWYGIYMIAVVDYGAGNLSSVVKAIHKLGYDYKITSQAEDVIQNNVIVLPGVGAAGDTMSKLKALGLIEPIVSSIQQNKAFLGICLGLQILLTNTEESGGQACLNLIPGIVRKLPFYNKIPHMGWNQVRQTINHPLFRGISDNANFYFVHSYYADPADSSVVAGETEYGLSFCSMIIRGNVVATQFHPEKSGEVGLKLLRNYFEYAINA